MLYLSGAARSELYGQQHAGFLLTPMMGNRPALQQTWWAADTGCFAAPKRYTDAKYFAWLHKQRRFRYTNLFATAPDVVGDAQQTWERSSPILPLLRDGGWRAALVAQDGIEDTDIQWDAFDVLFVGGTTDWKLSAVCRELVGEAARRGVWVHMGRVNSLKRLMLSMEMGCSSADGTFLCYGPQKNMPRLLYWLNVVNKAERERLGIV